MDRSKILVSVKGTGISGNELQRRLCGEYGIELEMACSSYVCALTSVADREEDLQRLVQAFLDLDRNLAGKSVSAAINADVGDAVIPARQVCTLLEAEAHPKEKCALEKAEGRVSGDFVTLYPPGIPILAPGEGAEKKILERIRRYMREGLEVDGVHDGQIRVWKEEESYG